MFNRVFQGAGETAGANLAREREVEERAFDCSTCGRTEKMSVEVDPMKPMLWAGSPASFGRRADVRPTGGVAALFGVLV
jgi:hypothetical protein